MKRFREEQGIAMVTGLMVALVVLFLSLVVVNLSVHNTATSGRDRDRTQAINGAEAGLDAWFSGLTSSTGSTICSPTAWDGIMPTSPGTSYDVTITLYSTWPPVPGTEIACTTPLPAAPLGALITSKGTTLSAQTAAQVTRTMQSEVKLVPVYGGFQQGHLLRHAAEHAEQADRERLPGERRRRLHQRQLHAQQQHGHLRNGVRAGVHRHRPGHHQEGRLGQRLREPHQRDPGLRQRRRPPLRTSR